MEEKRWEGWEGWERERGGEGEGGGRGREGIPSFTESDIVAEEWYYVFQV